MDGKYFKIDGRYYYVQSLQFQQGTPGRRPRRRRLRCDRSARREQGQGGGADPLSRRRPGGFHNIFAYKHSDGRVAAVRHDQRQQGAGLRSGQGGERRRPGHLADRRGAEPDAVPADRRRRLPRLLRRLRPRHAPGQVLRRRAGRILGLGRDPPRGPDPAVHHHRSGHSTWPTPSRRRPTDATPSPRRSTSTRRSGSGTCSPVSPARPRTSTPPISAWTADWRDLSHNHEVRWPYVFVSAYEDGLQVFRPRGSEAPEDRWAAAIPASASTSRASAASPENGWQGDQQRGAGRLRHRRAELRRADRAVSDMRTGTLALQDRRASTGWNGHDYGMPNISSVQDWDTGPEPRRTCGLMSTVKPAVIAGRRSCSWARPRPVRHSALSTPTAPAAQGSRAAGLRAVAVRRRGDRRRPRELRRAVHLSGLPAPVEPWRVHGLRRVGRDDRLSEWHRLGVGRQRRPPSGPGRAQQVPPGDHRRSGLGGAPRSGPDDPARHLAEHAGCSPS